MANGKPNPYLCHLDQQQNFNGFVKLLEDAVENQSKKDVEPKKRDANKVLKFKKLDNKNKITPDVRFQDISDIIAELKDEVAILEQQNDDIWHKEYMGQVRENSGKSSSPLQGCHRATRWWITSVVRAGGSL